ncbi:unnamed protein product, partial [Chrysoparadoxa australica]
LLHSLLFSPLVLKGQEIQKAFVVFDLKADLESFEQIVISAKENGDTHVEISRNIPPSLWQFYSPDDPKPAWYVVNPRLLKKFPPEEVKPFVDLEYARLDSNIILERFKIPYAGLGFRVLLGTLAIPWYKWSY